RSTAASTCTDLRPSRRPLRGLLRMTTSGDSTGFVMVRSGRQAASRTTQGNAMTDDRSKLLGLIMGAWPVQVIHVAVRLHLPDLMAEGETSSAALAEKTQSDPRTLRRLMRGMAALGLCRQLDEDRFELTSLGGLLKAGGEESVRGVALHYGERIWGAMSQLDQSVKTGRPWR